MKNSSPYSKEFKKESYYQSHHSCEFAPLFWVAVLKNNKEICKDFFSYS